MSSKSYTLPVSIVLNSVSPRPNFHPQVRPGYLSNNTRPKPIATLAAFVQTAVNCAESLLLTGSNGLPPPVLPPSSESSVVGSGAGLDVEVSGVGAEDSALVGSCASEVDVLDSSSVRVTGLEVLDGGRTVVKVSAGLLEVRVVAGIATELVLEPDIGLSGVGDTRLQSTPTRLPANACPRTVLESTSRLPQAICRAVSILMIPLTQSAEQVFPLAKSFNVQPGMGLL